MESQARESFVDRAKSFLKKDYNGVLLLAALFVTLTFFSYYPSYFVSVDEHEYLKNAHLILTGTTQTHDPYLYCGGKLISENTYASAIPLGKSISLIPFTFLPFSFVFLSGILIHLLNFLLFIWILRRLKVPAYWALLYLFFPAFLWEARTLFSELFVLTLFLAGYLSWLKGTRNFTVLSGALLGFAAIVRYDAGIAVVAFAAYAFVSERNRLLPFLVGSVPFLIGLLGINLWTYGGLFNSSYGSISGHIGRGLNPRFLIELATLILFLVAILPFSWFSLVRKFKHSLIFGIISIGALLFFTQYSYFSSFEVAIPQLLTARVRYFIPMIGMLMIPAVIMYNDWLHVLKKKITISKNVKWAVLGVLALVLMGGTLMLNQQHDRLGDSRGGVASVLSSVIPENSTVYGNSDSCIYFLYPVTGTKYYIPITTAKPDPIPVPGSFILDVRYYSQAPVDTVRQEVVEKELLVVKNFIKAHQDELLLVASHQGEYDMNVWQFSTSP